MLRTNWWHTSEWNTPRSFSSVTRRCSLTTLTTAYTTRIPRFSFSASSLLQETLSPRTQPMPKLSTPSRRLLSEPQRTTRRRYAALFRSRLTSTPSTRTPPATRRPRLTSRACASWPPMDVLRLRRWTRCSRSTSWRSGGDFYPRDVFIDRS